MPLGFVVWFTGLSGSGKSTLAQLVAEDLETLGMHTELLDGDRIRSNLSGKLGFSRADRDENIHRIGFVAQVIERCGSCAIAAAISPYRAARGEVRRSVSRFVEVYTECPLSVLVERDPKGLYKRAMAGALPHFTGIDDPYEPPLAPEVHLRTDLETKEESLAKILSYLGQAGLSTRHLSS